MYLINCSWECYKWILVFHVFYWISLSNKGVCVCVCVPVPVRFINPIPLGPEELHTPAISGHNTYDTSLSKTTVPTCLKVSTIVSVSKALTVSCVSEYYPVAFTPAMIKYFKRQVTTHIKKSIDITADSHQYACSCSTLDAIPVVIHQSLTHLKNKYS